MRNFRKFWQLQFDSKWYEIEWLYLPQMRSTIFAKKIRNRIKTAKVPSRQSFAHLRPPKPHATSVPQRAKRRNRCHLFSFYLFCRMVERIRRLYMRSTISAGLECRLVIFWLFIFFHFFPIHFWCSAIGIEANFWIDAISSVLTLFTK